MPTVNSISTTNTSAKISRANLHRANNSVVNRANSIVNQTNVRERLNNYAAERENFNAEFDATMSSLRASADRLRAFQNRDDDGGALTTLGGFATAEIPPEERDKIRVFQQSQLYNPQDFQNAQPAERFNRFAERYLVAERNDTAQNLNATRDENTNAALSNVRDFVNTFNNAVDYFNENRGVSDRMNALASNFGNEANLSALDDVGISVNENGRLRVDESKFADALNEDSANVNALLGQNGLAGRLDRNINLANSQRENLFPTAAEYTGNDPTQSLYSAQGRTI